MAPPGQSRYDPAPAQRQPSRAGTPRRTGELAIIRKSYIVAFLVALGVVALVTPVVLAWSRRLGLYDQPDADRKIHVRPIPRTGGLAIALGLAVPFIGLAFWGNDFTSALRQDEERLVAFLGGFVAILGLGVYDDLRGVGAWGKLSVQLLVGLLLWTSELRVDSLSIFDHHIQLGLWSLPLTMLWVAGFVNAMNLIDGLDGLAAGVAFFASASLFGIALIDGSPFLALMGAVTGGAALGFLLFNFSPAMIFMGDSGSMIFGYVFAVAGLWSASKRASAFALGLPLVALGIPLADTAVAFLRRALSGRSPFHADRGHIHHRLIDLGLTHRQAVLLIYAVCVTLTATAILLRITEDLSIGASMVALTLTVVLGVRLWMRRKPREADKPGGP